MQTDKRILDLANYVRKQRLRQLDNLTWHPPGADWERERDELRSMPLGWLLENHPIMLSLVLGWLLDV